MTSTVPPRVTRYRRLWISCGVTVAVMILLGALSIFWLPGYAKSQLEIRLSELLQRPVTVASIEIKPHTLELIVTGFHIGEKADANEPNAALFSFTRLHVDLSIESFTRRAPVVTAITLAEPKLRLVRETKDRLNISDLIEQFSQPSDKEEAPDDKSSVFSVSNITIQEGHLEFIDRPMKTDHQITEINLGIPIIANFDSTLTHWIEPHFSAKINGASLSLDGKLRPFVGNQEATLAFKLSAFDLTEFDQYAPLPEGIHLLSGHLDSDLLLTFTQAPDKAPDIILTGAAKLRQLAVKNSAVDAPYQASLKQLAIALTHIDLTGKKPSQIKLNMDQMALTREGEKESALALAKLAVDSIKINPASRQVAVGELTLDRLSAILRRESDGAIDLTRLFSTAQTQPQPQPLDTQAQASVSVSAKAVIPIPARKPAHSASEMNIAEKASTQHESVPKRAHKDESLPPNNAAVPWTTEIKRIKLLAAALRYEDLTLTKITPMVVDSLDITLDDIDLKGIKPLNLSLQAQVNQHGHIKTDGSLAWAPLAADLTLNFNAVDLVSLQGWAGDNLTALLTSGDISFEGKIKASGEPLKVQANGQAKLANFNVFDAKAAQDLLRWKKLDINDLNFVNDPLRVDIKTITLGDFFARMTILPDGNLNLKHIIKQDQPSDPQIVVADAASTDIQPIQPKKETPVHIDKVLLQKGNINFSDQFIKPHYRANLTGLSGQVGPLHPGKSGKINIHGALDKTAPLEIQGTIDPFSAELLLDLVTKVKDIDLPPFSPYSSKYIGYVIEKGKLSADVHYHVEQGALTAENKIFLDQFTLGDKVESEGASSLPLNLAITLLKNRRGEINIHLPLKGSINDPQFNLGAIILDAFVNLITKAITSPFALLGSVLGGGEELSEITFTPGFANIEEEAAKRLQTLAEVLTDRPSLKLEISGHVDPTTDHEGLKLAILQDKVKAQKLAADAKKGITTGAITEVTLTPEDYSKYLEIAYKKESFEKPKNAIGLTKSLPNAEMEQLMLANIQINESDLEALAERRATAARNWLIEQSEIAGERIFVVDMHDSKEGEQKKGNRVEFLLK